MSQYKAIYLEHTKKSFVEGDDFLLDFYIMDEEGTVLTDLSGWTFKGELWNDANEVRCSASYFTVSGGKITLHIPNTDTEELSDEYPNSDYYTLEIQGTLSSKIYTLIQMEIKIISQEIDY